MAGCARRGAVLDDLVFQATQTVLTLHPEGALGVVANNLAGSSVVCCAHSAHRERWQRCSITQTA